MVSLRKAVGTEAKPLIGLYAESGRGKTYGALLIAKGFVDDMSQVVMIETEAGRGEVHADDPVLGGYNVIPLRENFSPKVYGEAISVAERAKAKVLIIDSASHEWEGVGGVLAMAEELRPTAGSKGMWRAPKLEHSREFMLRMTQTPIPLVICNMRAKYPMYEVTKGHVDAWEKAGRPGGKPPKIGDWARSWQLEPKQSDDILSEMFVHGWIDEEHRFHLTKDTIKAMREIFLDREPLSIDTGRRLAAWAARRATKPAPQQSPESTGTPPVSASLAPAAADAGPLTDEEKLLARARENAEAGAGTYEKFWTALTAEQRRAIGAGRHENFKRQAQGGQA
jgi:hypothetical protein